MGSPIVIGVGVIYSGVRVLAIYQFCTRFRIMGVSGTTISILFQRGFYLTRQGVFLFRLVAGLYGAGVRGSFKRGQGRQMTISVSVSIRR